MAYTTINNSTDYFNTKLYTGTGSSHAITGVGFQPDWTWIKQRADDNYSHEIYDAVRGVTKYIVSDTSAAEGTNSGGLTTFGTDGFTVTTSNIVNKNSKTYVAWNWKANGQGSSNTDGSINTTYTSVNTTAGFSICKWSGTGSAGTIGHGLGAVPKMIICKNTDTTVNWIVYHNKLDASSPQNKYIELNANTALQDYPMWNDTAPTNSYFSVGSDIATNKSGSPMIAYCFAEKTGYSKFGSYEGNGNADGPFVYTGFKPAFVIIKNAAASEHWRMYDNKRDSFNLMYKCLFPNLNSNENTTNNGSEEIDFFSNGFKIRSSSGQLNGTNQSHIYMCFGQSIVGSNGVTAKAR